MRIKLIGICLVLAVLSCAHGPAFAAAPGVVVQSAKGEFEDVRERVVLAISNQGLVLNYTAHVGTMLDRTGKDIGRDRPIYDQAEVLEFCSAGVSRSTMEANPHNIVYCPYAIAVYTLPAQPGRVYIAYRKPVPTGSAQSVKALREVGRLLDGIAREAVK
jgi:uncharacterized protein (DUF302 family)